MTPLASTIADLSRFFPGHDLLQRTKDLYKSVSVEGQAHQLGHSLHCGLPAIRHIWLFNCSANIHQNGNRHAPRGLTWAQQ